MRLETFKEPKLTRTVSPSVHPRLASGDATDFFLASALSFFHQQALRPPGGEDAQCVQPISATQSNCVYPPRAFPTHSRHFRSGDASWSLGLHAVNRGTERFTTFVLTASADRPFQHSFDSCPFALRRFVFEGHERGRFLPTALMRSSL